jgi:hypothetical protein
MISSKFASREEMPTFKIGWIKAVIGFTRPKALLANRNVCQMPSMGSPSSGLAAPNT